MTRAREPRVPVTPEMQAAGEKRARELIALCTWTPAKSARYADAPHTYIIMDRTCARELWNEFATIIKTIGVMRSWRTHRYRYLVLDGFAYWVDWPALNRAAENTLDPLPPTANNI